MTQLRATGISRARPWVARGGALAQGAGGGAWLFQCRYFDGQRGYAEIGDFDGATAFCQQVKGKSLARLLVGEVKAQFQGLSWL